MTAQFPQQPPQSSTPQNLNSQQHNSRRISLLVPQPLGGNYQSQQNSNNHGPAHGQSMNGSVHTSSADGRVNSKTKIQVSDKKKKNQGKIAVNLQDSSQERAGNHKFSFSGYINTTLNSATYYENSNKKKSSQSRLTNESAPVGGAKLSVSSKNNHTTNTAYNHEQAQKMRTQTLSPPSAQKTNKMNSNAVLNNILSKSGSKNATSLQRSGKRINYLKSLVKKQQQKSLSRDFTNSLNINTSSNHPNTTTSQNSKAGGQFSLFKSHGGSNNILVASQSHNNSLSPNAKAAINLHSTLKKKKKATITKQPKKKDDNLAQSVQIFKPPINKNLTQTLMQSSLNLKQGVIGAMLLNESKDSGSQLRYNTTTQNFNTTVNTSLATNTTQSHNIANISAYNPSHSQKRKSHQQQQRSNTQERVLRMADEQVQQINQELDFSNKKQKFKAGYALSGGTGQPEQKILKNQGSQKDQQMVKQDKASKNLLIQSLQNENLVGGLMDKTFMEILENLQMQQLSINNEGSSTIHQKKQQANLTLIKSQLEMIKNSYEAIIKKLSEKSSSNHHQTLPQQQSLTERQNNLYSNFQHPSGPGQQQRLLTEREDQQPLTGGDLTTTHATHSNDCCGGNCQQTTPLEKHTCFSASSSFRTNTHNSNNQHFSSNNLLINHQQSQRILELETQNKKLLEQLKLKDDQIQHQEQIIALLKQEPKKEEVGIQANVGAGGFLQSHRDSIAGSRLGQSIIISERKANLLIENEQIKRQLKRLEKRVEYHKNKENKFLFFLFSLQNQGIPVNEIYEKEGIKDIPTQRFAEIMNEEGQMGAANQSSLMFSFYTDDSYELIDAGPDPASLRRKPQGVPSLNLNNLPEYESSSDEDNDEGKNNNEGQGDNHRNMTTQDYEQSLKYIENFYSKCGGGIAGTGALQGKTQESEEGADAIEEEEQQEDYIMCQINNGSSILMFDKEESQNIPSHFNPGSLVDDDFCYSVDKKSRAGGRRGSFSKDIKSI